MVSRRDWLAVTACQLTGLTIAGGFARTNHSNAAESGEGAKRGDYIDAHVHIWTPDVEAYPLAAGFRRKQMQPPSFTPEELFSHSRPSGVGRVVLIQMSFYGFDNRYMTDMMERHAGVFSGVAVIDENAPRPQDEMRHLKERGVRGFRIRPGDRPVDRWLDSDGMAAMWRYGARENLAMCHLVDPDSLPAIDRMCKRFPDTPVVIDHFARIGADGMIRERDVTMLCNLARHKQVQVKISAFYALGKKEPPYLDLVPMIRRLLDAYGPERLMWASDCPFQVDQHTYEDSISLIRDRLDFLSEGDRESLLTTTAEKTFFS
jgi:predicted TIM-barrel fold metal-dependent hydrolase